MQQYTTTRYTVEEEFEKSPEDLFEMITDLGAWWPEEFEGDCSGPGSEFILRTGNEHFSRNKVVEFIPGEKFEWITLESWRTSDQFDWKDTRFIFELEPKNKRTLLKFTYDGVVLENETARLAEICRITIKKMFADFAERKEKSFSATIEFSKPPGEIFTALTEQVSKWWGGKDFEGSSSELNDEFVIHHPGAHYSKQKIVALVPGKKITWKVTESKLPWLKDEQEWTNTRMIFEISEKGNGTLLKFMHEGLLPGKECFDKCSSGWTAVITDWLFNFIETGKPHFD